MVILGRNSTHHKSKNDLHRAPFLRLDVSKWWHNAREASLSVDLRVFLFSLQPILMFHLSPQSISSITEGASAAASSTEEPMQTDETTSAEAAAADEGGTAMETQAEVNRISQAACFNSTLNKIFCLFPKKIAVLLIAVLFVCFPREKQQQQLP